MEKLLGFKVGEHLSETFPKADRLSIRLGLKDIKTEFSLEEGELIVWVPKDQIEEAQSVTLS